MHDISFSAPETKLFVGVPLNESGCIYEVPLQKGSLLRDFKDRDSHCICEGGEGRETSIHWGYQY